MTCASCRYAMTAVNPQSKELQSQCRRYPPSPLAIPTPQGLSVLFVHPVVAADHGCGEHATKLLDGSKLVS